MRIYIDREFLTNFYIDWDEKNSTKEQNILYDILVKYPSANWYYEDQINTLQELEKIKNENPIFASKAATYVPHPIDSIKEELFHPEFTFRQVIVLTNDEKEWFEEAKHRGALCLTYKDYEQVIREFITKNTFNIDLSEKFEKWDVLESTLPSNQIIITDNYILSSDKNASIDKNLLPILKKLLSKQTKNNKIYILTKKIFNNRSIDESKKIKNENLSYLYRALGNYNCELFIMNNTYIHSLTNYNFHDRNILSDFQIIDCGVGFNLLPNHKPSNSQIISSTIFDLYTYKRMKNLYKAFSIFREKYK